MTAWHICICGISPVISADPLKLCHVGCGALMHSHFQVSPEMFYLVQVRALAGPPKDIHRLFLKPLLRCLGCVLRVAVMCLLLRNGCCLATLPQRPEWLSAAEMVVFLEGSPQKLQSSVRVTIRFLVTYFMNLKPPV